MTEEKSRNKDRDKSCRKTKTYIKMDVWAPVWKQIGQTTMWLKNP